MPPPMLPWATLRSSAARLPRCRSATWSDLVAAKATRDTTRGGRRRWPSAQAASIQDRRQRSAPAAAATAAAASPKASGPA